jgi:hypothetical protein
MAKSSTEVSFFKSDAVYEAMFEKEKDPETKLWQAILGQALNDAFGPDRYNTNPKDRAEALDFLKDFESESFIELCENAGYNPEYIKRKVRKKFAEKFISAINKLSTKARNINEQ